jgi:hypothetical protein
MVEPNDKGNKKSHPRHVENFDFSREGEQVKLLR